MIEKEKVNTALKWQTVSHYIFHVTVSSVWLVGVNLMMSEFRAPRPPTFPTFPTFPTKQVGTSYFEENSPIFPTFYKFYENVILI